MAVVPAVPEKAIPGIWVAAPPAAWAAPPQWLSVSSLLGIESCPRRWSLQSSCFPAVWAERGYPPRVSEAALRGQIIHGALERLARALTLAGCTSVDSADFVAVVRALGGHTSLLRASMSEILERHDGNPRFESHRQVIESALANALPRMRERFQSLLSALQLDPGEERKGPANSLSTPLDESETDESPQEPAAGGDRTRLPLSYGLHAEVRLVAEAIGWYGVADLIRLTPVRCEIVDFKTGAHRPEHEFQAHVYGLLWLRDTVANPSGRPPTDLTLAYPSGDVAVPLPADGWDAFEDQLRSRSAAALSLASPPDPPAHPSLATCSFCGVRQLCEVYWLAETQRQLARVDTAQISARTSFCDLEVELGRQRDAVSWNAILRVGRALPTHSEEAHLVQPGPVTVVSSAGSAAAGVLCTLSPGRIVRILGASLSPPPATEDSQQLPPLVALSSRSEAFVLTQ